MEILFPVFVLVKDSGDVLRFSSVQEMQRQLERIDIENSEYEAWDCGGRPLALSVQEPVWLSVRCDGSRSAPAALREALLRHASRLGVSVDPSIADEQLLFDEIREAAAKRRQEPSLWRRLVPRKE